MFLLQLQANYQGKMDGRFTNLFQEADEHGYLNFKSGYTCLLLPPQIGILTVSKYKPTTTTKRWCDLLLLSSSLYFPKYGRAKMIAETPTQCI